MDVFNYENEMLTEDDFLPDAKAPPQAIIRARTQAINTYIISLLNKDLKRRQIVGMLYKYHYRDAKGKRHTEKIVITEWHYKQAMKWRKEQWV